MYFLFVYRFHDGDILKHIYFLFVYRFYDGHILKHILLGIRFGKALAHHTNIHKGADEKTQKMKAISL